MPPLPAVPAVIRFSVEGRCGDGAWVNVLHFRYTGSVPDAAALNGFANDALNQWNSDFSSLMPTTSSVVRATAIDLSTPLTAAGVFEDTLVGTRAGTGVSACLAVLVSKNVARRYRGGHPRSYLAIGVEADLATASTWTAGLIAATTSDYEAFVTGMLADTHGGTVLASECVVSYVDKAVNPVYPFRRAVPLVLDVLGSVAKTAIAIQRSRMAG
jgi:hypothetical protein